VTSRRLDFVVNRSGERAHKRKERGETGAQTPLDRPGQKYFILEPDARLARGRVQRVLHEATGLGDPCRRTRRGTWSWMGRYGSNEGR
jgi:hypothetical protein